MFGLFTKRIVGPEIKIDDLSEGWKTIALTV